MFLCCTLYVVVLCLTACKLNNLFCSDNLFLCTKVISHSIDGLNYIALMLLVAISSRKRLYDIYLYVLYSYFTPYTENEHLVY